MVRKEIQLCGKMNYQFVALVNLPNKDIINLPDKSFLSGSKHCDSYYLASYWNEKEGSSPSLLTTKSTSGWFYSRKIW